MMRVRAAVGAFPKSFAENLPGGCPGAVLDGRDVGTVLLPHANLKLFITANDEVGRLCWLWVPGPACSFVARDRMRSICWVIAAGPSWKCAACCFKASEIKEK